MNSNQSRTSSAIILIVDDTADNVRLLSTILTEEGYQVRKALNGKRALATVQEFPPNLILLDVMMPQMNGYEVCAQLKASPKTSFIPVIFLSALGDVVDKVKAFDVGAVDYITKPFQDKEVLARVANQLTIQSQQKLLQEQTKQLEELVERLQNEIKERQEVELALRVAQKKSDDLLLNILPAAIVENLKKGEGSPAERFESATVLFADLVDFTSLAARISPLELVDFLNKIFSMFDELTEKHGLEKIKTIGDAYMVVGGLPVPRADHAEAIANMALDMQEAIADFKTDTGEPFQIRIGIHTGPVVAGVIGTKKFIYDLWGDTVNVASRMESQGLSGYIQVTAAVYEQLKDRYLFEEQGAIAVKGKGDMTVYWLKGKK
ncbi:MAG: response regulator [Microcoleus sp. PH2017_10_PVI_O_A]|uniref:adenylate/guanylate cyclase domain-containing protein n=1 Tax=unclassified Microcoleus TaxID=2642155 RepID=UPI001D8E93BD|nr:MULTISPECIES: adenylate/guanylate cyclase domain-containing protein [unclassified Microcoleus]TAE82579.1 MAG: response regulator [Oscillatoriales cyanobacterium]MCC3406669.1 response regulator [Microcoleus sp. PH2017_10_PVI_O_A]MCC3462103.1 response regulator [Microcoleus sp. PH2017_11_PCY_U_A]MCC3479228.1 response regulator [Microcoleus sp. PH2017_12_PCY_D_A]MCC3529486.1 response regulator [Microcoleus sp. PH2017_21_RUC_O_A]